MVSSDLHPSKQKSKFTLKSVKNSNNQKHSLLRLKITERIIKTVKLMRAERGWK